MSAPPDPLHDHAAGLLAELRERCAGEGPGEDAEELLIGGYAAALALEGARRRLRERALDLSERELALAAQERELRALLRELRARMQPAGPAVVADRSADEAAPQRLHRRL